jgi:hypothetical protein
MRTSTRNVTVALVPLAVLAVLGGCASRERTVTTVPAAPATVMVPAAPTTVVVPSASPATTTVVVPPANTPQRVIYAEGSYELRGAGTAGNPYYWVWIPRGSTVSVLPPPPPLPAR